MKTASFWLWALLGLGGLGGLGGCALQSPPKGEDIARQELPMMAVPPQWAAAQGHSSAAPPPHWLASFGDPRLSALAAEALRATTSTCARPPRGSRRPARRCR